MFTNKEATTENNPNLINVDLSESVKKCINPGIIQLYYCKYVNCIVKTTHNHVIT